MAIETGHAKNVANFGIVISQCTGFGPKYDPNTPALEITALTILHTKAKQTLTTIHDTAPPWIEAVNQRQLAFEPLSSLVTRVIASLSASDANKLIIEDAKTIARKIQGRRAEPKKKDDPSTPEDESEESISASQMSFDNRISNFEALIALLKIITEYNPNETELKTTALDTVLADLKTKNKAVVDTYGPLNDARKNRDRTLYLETSGLVPITKKVKEYVKSIFNASSIEYKQLNSIKFTTPSKLFL